MDSNPYQTTFTDEPTSARRFSLLGLSLSAVIGAIFLTLGLAAFAGLPATGSDWGRLFLIGGALGIAFAGVETVLHNRKAVNAKCSFCSKGHLIVGPLVEGPDYTYICGQCVELSQTIINQERERRLVDAEV